MAHKVLCDLYSDSSPPPLSSINHILSVPAILNPRHISLFPASLLLIRLFIYVYHLNKDSLFTSTLIGYLLSETFLHTTTLTPDFFPTSTMPSLTLYRFLLSYSGLFSCHSYLLLRPSSENWWFYSILCPQHLVMCQVHSGCCLAS